MMLMTACIEKAQEIPTTTRMEAKTVHRTEVPVLFMKRRTAGTTHPMKIRPSQNMKLCVPPKRKKSPASWE